MMACEASGLNMVEAFLRRGADVSLVDVFGQNALHYAKLSENIGIQTLLSSKISQDVGTWERLTCCLSFLEQAACVFNTEQIYFEV